MSKYILFTEAASKKYKDGINIANSIYGMELPVINNSTYYYIDGWDYTYPSQIEKLSVNPKVVTTIIDEEGHQITKNYTFKYFNTSGGSTANDNLEMKKILLPTDLIPGKYTLSFDLYSVFNNTTTSKNYCVCNILVKDEEGHITESYSLANDNTAVILKGLSTLDEIKQMGLTENDCEPVLRYADNYWDTYDNIKSKIVKQIKTDNLEENNYETLAEDILSNEEIFYLPKYKISAGRQLTDDSIAKSIDAFLKAGKYRLSQDITVKKGYTIEITLGKTWGNRYTYSIIDNPKLILYPFRKI